MTDTHKDVEEFLQAVFGSDWREKCFLCNSDWQRKRLEDLDLTTDCYWCIGAIPWGKTREIENVEDIRALVIDDVGEEVLDIAVEAALGMLTRSVWSSANNQQWVYRLPAPMPKDQWEPFFRGVKVALKQPKLHGPECNHVFRLPMGTYNNRKKPKKCGFKPYEGECHPGAVLNMSLITPVGPSKSNPVKGDGADIKLGIDDLRLGMSWLKNDARFDERNGDWVNVIGHGLKALCKDDGEGLTVYDEWSEPHPKHDPRLIRKAWDSYGARGLTSKGGKLKALWQAANPEGFAKIFAPKVFDDDEEAPGVAPGKGRVKFIRGKEKQILSLVENVKRAIVGLGIACTYDDFHHRAFVTRGGKLTDHMALLLRDELTTVYGKEFPMPQVFDAIMTLALQNRFNPVVDMLAEAERNWDKVQRLDRLGVDYFHTEDTPLVRACFRKMMIAAVRRARRPGCKFDQILVLESPEGWDKSTAWAVLAGEGNFSDASIIGKDARAVQEELADIWIHENAELSGLGKADIEHVKAFASKVNDRARAAYGRVLTDQPRQSIEVGTTNAEAYLMSPTGNRRFWGFKLEDRVDTARLRVDRLQLWGEAAVAESSGETLVLDEALWDEAGIEQEKRRVIDPWEDELANLDPQIMGKNGGFLTISSIAIHDFLGGHRGQPINSGSGRKIAEIMKRLGWERCELKDAVGKRMRGYRRPLASVHPRSSVPKNLF